MDWREHIEFDMDVCQGKAHFRDTEVPVRRVLEMMARGVPPRTILLRLPEVNQEMLEAAILYAAERRTQGDS